jgi:hypothetical protein
MSEEDKKDWQADGGEAGEDAKDEEKKEGDEDKKDEEGEKKDEKKEEEDSSDDEDDENAFLKEMNPMNQFNKFFPADEEDEWNSLDKKKTGTPILTQCCCCICNCATKATEGVTCCCVVPIKCGITTIGVFTILLAAVGISAQFFLILNDNVKWWYCLVNLLLLLPQYIAAGFFISWFGHDTIQTRGNLSCGCIMVIVSEALIAAWVIIYFVWIYEGDTVYYGWGTTEAGYIKFAKKYYIFRELAFVVIIITLFSYFICICGRYSTALKVEKDKAEKKQWVKTKLSRQRAQDDLDKHAKNKDYINVKAELEKQNKKDRKKAAKKAAKKEEGSDSD